MRTPNQTVSIYIFYSTNSPKKPLRDTNGRLTISLNMISLSLSLSLSLMEPDARFSPHSLVFVFLFLSN